MESRKAKNISGGKTTSNTSGQQSESNEGSFEDDGELFEPETCANPRKPPHIYTDQDDVDILFAERDVKPFGKNSTELAWKEVHDQLRHIKTDWKSKKNRFLHEIKWFKTHDSKCKRGSGIVENYNMKDELLTELIPIMKEAELEKAISNSDRTKRLKEKTAGEEIRKAAMTTLISSEGPSSPGEDQENSEPSVENFPETPKSKRGKRNELLELIRENQSNSELEHL